MKSETWVNADGTLGVYMPACHGLPAMIMELEDWGPEEFDNPPVRRGSILEDVLYYILVAGMLLMLVAVPIAYTVAGINCDSKGGVHYSVVMCYVPEPKEPFIYRIGVSP